jgi:serine/threonine protein phosphatase PrpC
MITYHFSAKTDVGLVRKANEDNLGNALTPNGHVFVVCDGMGGHVGGAKASQIAVSSILEFFMKQEYENLFTAIDRSLQFANEQIYAVSIAEPELHGMGTTATILIIKGDACYIGHVGDSRIYLKSDGKLNRITKDHSFVQTLVDSGVISDEEAEHHPKKNQILKALGIAPIIEPTVAGAPIYAKAGDCFLLCSDGLNGMVNDLSMEMMIDEKDLDRSASILIQAAKDSGGHDNISVALVGILESPHKTTIFKHFNPTPKSALESTQLMTENTNSTPFFKNKFFYVTVSLVVLIAAVAIWIGSQELEKGANAPDPEEILTKESLYNTDTETLEKIQSQNNKILSENDTIIGSVCSCKIIIEDSVIVEIIQNDDMKKKIIIKEVPTSPKDDKKESVDKKPSAVKSNCGSEIKHLIISGDGYDKILKKYKKNCDSLSVDYLKQMNDQKELKANDTLTFNCLCKKK